jgi:hypothetical protein
VPGDGWDAPVPYTIEPAGMVLDGEGRHPAPWPVVRGTGAEALGLLDEIRRSEPGVTPVLIGDRRHAQGLIDNCASYDIATESILATAAALDCDRWLQAREQELRDDREADNIRPARPSFWRKVLGHPHPAASSVFPRGPWPAAIPNREVHSVADVLRRTPLPEIYIALLPTREAWQAGAYTRFGGWNECPAAEVQVAFAKRWFRLHGASVVANTADVLEFRVERPISSRDEALAMAREQYLFCEDIVEQGVGTLDALAATLLDATVWYFWWD